MLQGKQRKAIKKPARTPGYTSPNQLTIQGFGTPFEQALTSENRWVKLSRLLPWDKIAAQYNKQFKSTEGRQPLNRRIVIGAVIIKHMLKLSDREIVQQIQENVFMQYFLGYSSFTNEAPFDASVFVAIRQRLSLEVMSSINEIIIAHHFENTVPPTQSIISAVAHTCNDENKPDPPSASVSTDITDTTVVTASSNQQEQVVHKGGLLMDATVAPQNITFPTALKLLNAAREKSEELVDKLYCKEQYRLSAIFFRRSTAQ